MCKRLIVALAITAAALASTSFGSIANAKMKDGAGPCGAKDPTCVCTVIWNGKCPKK